MVVLMRFSLRPSRKNTPIITWVDRTGDGRPLDRDQHVVLPHGSLVPGSVQYIRFVDMVERWIGYRRTTCIGEGSISGGSSMLTGNVSGEPSAGQRPSMGFVASK